MSSSRVFKTTFLLILCCLIFRCSDKKKSGIEKFKYKISNFLNTCHPNEFSDNITLNDSLRTFTIKIPSTWDREIVFDENVNGVFVMDTSLITLKGLNHSMFINVLSDQYKPLPEHFADDIYGMEQDSLQILEIGEYSISDQKYDALWLITDDKDSKTLFIYSKGPFKDKMFIVSINISSGDNSKERFCSYFKSIINSIKFNLSVTV